MYKCLNFDKVCLRACGATDNASDYGSEDSRFESWQARNIFTSFFSFLKEHSAIERIFPERRGLTLKHFHTVIFRGRLKIFTHFDIPKTEFQKTICQK